MLRDAKGRFARRDHFVLHYADGSSEDVRATSSVMAVAQRKATERPHTITNVSAIERWAARLEARGGLDMSRPTGVDEEGWDIR